MTKAKSTTTSGARTRTTAARPRKAALPVEDVRAEPPYTARATPPAERAPTKQAVIIALLQRQEGATLADLGAATGWLPHTTRAALTRLRQSGHRLEKTKGETGSVYRIAKPARAVRSRKVA